MPQPIDSYSVASGMTVSVIVEAYSPKAKSQSSTGELRDKTNGR